MGYPIEEFEALLTDNPEFLESITNDIVAKIKQSDVPVEEVEVEEDVVEEVPACTSVEPAIIETTIAEPTTIYEQLKQQALANNDLL
jgi:hypothetical protein